jgi:hypothetical protein
MLLDCILKRADTVFLKVIQTQILYNKNNTQAKAKLAKAAVFRDKD